LYKRTHIIVEIDVIEPKYLPAAAALAAFLAMMVVAVVVAAASIPILY
jgi:CRISPR/Cas system-associated endonuclease/helicase Cas3